MADANPLLSPATLPYGLPDYREIAPEHYLPAFEEAFAEHRREIDAITRVRSMPTFENTVVALERSGDLLGEPELRTWFRTVEDLAPYLEEVGGAQESPLVLNQLQQQERYDDIINRAIDATYGGEHRASWGRRLTELARYFAASRRPARAAEADAVAAALEAGTAPREIPFCGQLVRASLAFYVQLAAQQQAERAKGSLIVTPGQAAREREPRS